MDFERYMITSLSALLKKKECLQLSFYGKLLMGSMTRPKEYYCFFGLAGDDLLVVSYSPLFQKNGFAVRVPLNIQDVKIKKALISEKYLLRFRLNQTEWRPFEKFKISVKSDHAKLKSQKENVTKFLSYLEKYV